MATSGNFSDYGYANTSSTNGLGLYCEWSATQSVENNTSEVTVNVYVNSYSLYVSPKTTTISAFGQTKTISSNNVSDSNNTWDKQYLGSTKFTVEHNSDGTKSGSISINWSCNATVVNGATFTIPYMTASKSVTLTTIARATTPTLSSSSYDMGTTITINTPRASNSFTHNLYFQIGSSAKTQFATGVTTSHNWSDNLYLINWLPNTTSGIVTIYCQTYNGSTYIGEKSVTFTGKVPSNIEPTIDSFTIGEYVEEVKTKIGKYVKGKSRLSIGSSASGNYGSTIVSYKITANGETFTSSSAVTNVLKNSGTQTISVIVTDSRGRSVVRGQTIGVVDYYSPQANAITVNRCNSDGTLNEDGTYLKANFTYNIAPINNLNGKTVKVQYLNGSTWTTLTTLTNSYSGNNQTYISTQIFSVDSSYTIRLVVEDAFSSDEITNTLKTAFTLMNYNASGKGIAFGKVSEKDAIEFGMDVYDKNGNLIGHHYYSTEEQVIGTYLDKPLYRKTFYVGTVSSNQLSIGRVPNIDILVNKFGPCRWNTILLVLNDIWGNTNGDIAINDDRLTEMTDISVTVEYTKTTD